MIAPMIARNIARNIARRSDFEACRKILRAGSKSFYASSLFLPPAVRPPVYALYAFCRVADDEIDIGGGAVATLRARLRLAYEGRPLDTPVDRAFSATVLSHKIPHDLPEALLAGFEWDRAQTRYRTLSDVRAYGARVAGSVGAMMTLVMGAASAEALARACDLGVAMQLTNIARDVGEDARAGRLYLPLEWFDEAGLDPDNWLRAPVFNESIAEMVRRLLEEADRLYARAEPGIALLPLAARPAIRAASRIYAEIGAKVAERGYDSVNARASIGSLHKLALLAEALRGGAIEDPCAPPLEETAFLVSAAARQETNALPRGLRNRVIRVIALIERLERAERLQGASRARNAEPA
jgi:phytoene synthase